MLKIGFISLLICLPGYSAGSYTLEKSCQLLLVVIQDWHTAHGTMQRYQRNNARHTWNAVGKPLAVVIGKNGLALMKKEGDLRSPAGIFPLGTAFGFSPDLKIKMPYLQLTADSICVDDLQSKYYNRIINADSIMQPDWKSGEKMREIPQYQYGALIQYNTNHPVAGAGSCIFLHVWRHSDVGTAGCVAMQQSDLKQVLNWLDAAKQPAIALLPRELYKKRAKNLGLPIG